MNNGHKIIMPNKELIVPEQHAKPQMDPRIKGLGEMIMMIRRAKDAGLAALVAVLAKVHAQGLNLAVDASIPEGYVVVTVNNNIFFEGDTLKVSTGQMIRLGTKYESALQTLREQLEAAEAANDQGEAKLMMKPETEFADKPTGENADASKEETTAGDTAGTAKE